MALEYRREALETIARNELKKYDPSLISGEPRAIPIEDIVERHYGLTVGIPLSPQKRHCAGLHGV